MINVMMSAYIVFALFSVSMTYKEQKSSGVASPLMRVVGFGLCVVWPLTLMFFASAYALKRA